MTMKNYTKLKLTDLSAAVEKLPESQPQILQADGTTGQPILVARPADFDCVSVNTPAKSSGQSDESQTVARSAVAELPSKENGCRSSRVQRQKCPH